MKRFLSGLAVLLLLAGLCGTAAHALMLSPGGSGTEIIVLSGVMANLDKDIIILEETEELTAAHFPMGNLFGYLDSEGRGQIVPVEWKLDAEELAEPGLHEVVCTPVLSEAVTLAEGYDGVTTWPVFRKGGDAVLIVESVTLPKVSITEVLVPENSDCAEEVSLTTAVKNCRIRSCWLLDVRKDPEFYWEWDLSAVDTSVPGGYPVMAKLHSPEWVSFPAEFRQYEQMVYVLPEDRIEIYAGVQLASDGELTIHWLYDSVNVAEAVLEREAAEDVWEACPAEWYTYYLRNEQRDAYLILKLGALPAETPLTLRLRYTEVSDGETTERTTAPVRMEVPENWQDLIQDIGHTPLISVLDGDRDGGDSGGAVLPDIEQPAPLPAPSDPIQKLQADIRQYLRLMTEVVTDTSTTVFGLRVNLQASREKTVLFEKQGIAAEIPSECLLGLSLSAEDRLKVTILAPEKSSDTVQFSVMVNDSPVEELPGTVIRMPWKTAPAGDGELICQDANEKEVSSAVYDRDSGIVRFSVPGPGVYRLSEPGETNKTILQKNSSAV